MKLIITILVTNILVLSLFQNSRMNGTYKVIFKSNSYNMPTGRISFQDSIYQVNISNRKTIHGKIEYGEYLTHLKGYSSPDIIFSISSSEMNKDTISFQAINTNIESWRNIVINGQLIKE